MPTLLIDTDPGVDDALALLMAFADPATEVAALTIAAGNVGLEHTVANALKLCEVAGQAVPVHSGCPGPLLPRTRSDAAFVHGRDGFGDVGYTPAARAAETEHAALAMLRLANTRPGELTFLMLGPLTNLALALRLDPDLPSKVARLVVMGGAVTGRGNTSTSAEFNFGFDPEAADIVCSGWPRFELVDWEATLAHPLPYDDLDCWLAADAPRARFYDAISRRTRDWMQGAGYAAWHAADALAMAVALAPEGVQDADERHIAIECAGTHTRGASIIDWDQRNGHPANARILQRYDMPLFQTLLKAALATH